MARLLKSKLFWAIATPVALLALYALVGFKLAPKIARDQAQAFVREHYGRELAVGEIAIHPFKLQAEVRDVSLPDADGRPMLGFERLFVDFEVASLWNRAYTFRQVTIEGPRLHAVVRPGGTLNLADLALPEKPEEPDEPLPSTWIQTLEVARGAVQFTDEARAEPLTRSFEQIGVVLQDFRTTPQGGDFRFTARSLGNETFEWQGRFALEPVIASRGEFRIGALQAHGILEFLGDVHPFTATRGTVEFAGSYDLTLGGQTDLDIEIPAIRVDDLSLRARGADADWVSVPSLVASGVSVALLEQSVRVATLAFDAPSVQAWMSADGSVNLEQYLAGPPGAEGAAEPEAQPAGTDGTAAAPADGTGEDAGSWTLAIGSIELTNGSVAFEDRSMTPATTFQVAPIRLQVSDASLDLSRPLPVELEATVNGHAQFAARGQLTPEPLAAELDVELARARMQILQPYVLPVADLTITGGELDVAGRVDVAPAGASEPEIRFAGNVAIQRFKSVDNALKEDFINFARLDLRDVRYAMAPDSLSIDRVQVRKPYARVIISRDQVVNIAAVLDPEGTAAALRERRAAAAADEARTPAERRRLERERAAAEKAAAKAQGARDGKPADGAPPKAARPAPPDTFPIRIREVRVEGGRMNFSDYFIQPNFSADIQDLGGRLTGLSSAYDARAQVELSGKLEEFSPVSITGELQPFAFDAYTDVDMRFSNIALPIFNPYSGPLAGYNIAKGKLTVDLHYTIEDRKLDAQHKVRIDQLEWGEATDTQGEATLPVKFATSLLKDRDGVINLDVPVGGTLDDPTFRIGPIVWQIIKNIITKAVTAPFALLGSLFAGAEEARYVDFAPGEAGIDEATAGNLGALAKSLVEKPQLRLEVPIAAQPELDRPALMESAYRAALDSAASQDAGRGSEARTYDSLEPKQRIAALQTLVRQQTGAEPVIPEPPEPPKGTSRSEARAMRDAAAVEFLEKTVRDGVVVAESEFARLAEERANAIERALLADGTLDPTRVFKVRDGKVSIHEGQVRYELGLE